MSAVAIHPDVLEFKSPFTVQSTEYASITNNSDETIAFKVKTTAPKFYCVRPNAAVVAPGETVQVQIILLGLSEEPEADFKCRDKFLVITLPAPYDLEGKSVADVWPSLETEFKQQAVSKKMKVKYLISSEPQVDEKTQEQEQKPLIADEPKEIVEEKQHKPLQPQPETPKPVIQQPEEVKEEVRKEVKKEAAPKASVQTTKEEKTQANKEEASLNTNTLILIALIALILGWLYY